MKTLISTFLLFIAAINTAAAHHGLDFYDASKLVEIDGQVIEFQLLAPHSILVVEIQNSDGTSTVWEVEGGTASGIIGAGLTQKFLRSKPKVHVKGFQTKDGNCSPLCRMSGQEFDFE